MKGFGYREMLFAFMGILIGSLLGCQKGQELTQPHLPAQTADTHQSTRSNPVSDSASAIVTEISVENEPGYVSDLSYYHLFELTIRNNNAADYVTVKHGGMHGTYQAMIPASVYERLARLVLKANLRQLRAFYGPMANDVQVITISVVQSGKRKTVMVTPSERDKGIPLMLERLEQEMEQITKTTRWRRVSENVQWSRHLPALDGLSTPKRSGTKKEPSPKGGIETNVLCCDNTPDPQPFNRQQSYSSSRP
jgi:hypothetical protein